MNSRQRLVIALGTIALAVHTVSFTPYDAIEIKSGVRAYTWLERKSLWRSMRTDPKETTSSTTEPLLTFHPTRLLIEWGVIVLITTGTTLAVGGRRKS